MDFALYGSWEVLDRCKILVQGPLRISTPGKLHSENFLFSTFCLFPPNQLIMSPSQLIMSPSQLIMSPSQLIMSPSQLIMSSSQLIMSSNQLIMSPSQLIPPSPPLLPVPSPSYPHPDQARSRPRASICSYSAPDLNLALIMGGKWALGLGTDQARCPESADTGTRPGPLGSKLL